MPLGHGESLSPVLELLQARSREAFAKRGQWSAVRFLVAFRLERISGFSSSTWGLLLWMHQHLGLGHPCGELLNDLQLFKPM